jgi:hypothetical protein
MEFWDAYDFMRFSEFLIVSIALTASGNSKNQFEHYFVQVQRVDRQERMASSSKLIAQRKRLGCLEARRLGGRAPEVSAESSRLKAERRAEWSRTPGDPPVCLITPR